MEQRFARRSAWLVFAVSAFVLVAWVLMGPVVRGLKPGAGLMVYPLTALSLMLAALALAASAGGWRVQIARVLAAAVVILSAVFLAEIAAGRGGGVDIWRRPAPQTSLSLLLIGLATIVASVRRESRLDAADMIAAAAVLLPFVLLLGYLFEATQMTRMFSGSGARDDMVSPIAVALLLLLAIGVLTLETGRGLIAAFTEDSAAAMVGRRLLPWVVLLPVLFGWMQMWSVRSGLLELPLALALTVTISILAFMLLIYWITHMMTQVEARQAARHIERESQAKEEGMTDALTELLNRRGWERHLRLEEERCKVMRLNGCVVMIDLDDLKKVNDTQGHSQGDELIKRAGQALRSGARSGDVLARLGGDEFAYLAIGCQPEHAGVVVRRLVDALMKHQVGASLGYAMRDINTDLHGAFEEADRSMYANKRARKAKRASMLAG